MVIEWDATIDDESERYIYEIMNSNPMEQGNPILKNIIIAAQEKTKEKGYVRITNGIHTNFNMLRLSKENKTFVPYWFDVIASLDGKSITAETNKVNLHIYIGLYILTQDYYGNLFYQRYDVDAKPETSYSPDYINFNKHIIAKWFPTGRVTDSHLYNEEIVMMGGSSNKISEEKIPVKLNAQVNDEVNVKLFEEVEKKKEKFRKCKRNKKLFF